MVQIHVSIQSKLTNQVVFQVIPSNRKPLRLRYYIGAPFSYVRDEQVSFLNKVNRDVVL